MSAPAPAPTSFFLCSCVSTSTIQDEHKLQRLLKYLHGTIHLKLHLSAYSLTAFSTWVDASFAVHPDMRSHTGSVISFGRGGIICKSKKQNITTTVELRNNGFVLFAADHRFSKYFSP
jgi:hypothetical protein